MAQRRILVLSDTKTTTGDRQLAGVFWLDAPVNKQIQSPGLVSRVPLDSVVSWGVSAAELALLRAGAIVEQTWDSGQLSSSLGPTPVENGLVNAFNAAQTALADTNPPSKIIGTFWDGTTWTIPA